MAAVLPSLTSLTVRCGPRDARPPLQRGRTLSSESIHAIQHLKRAHKLSQPLPTHHLTRLLKPDLTAAFAHLVSNPDHLALALHVFRVLREEHPPIPLDTYAQLVKALAVNGLTDEADRLVGEMERDRDGAIDMEDSSSKGLLRLVKAVNGANSRESTVRIYRMMRKGGWGDTWQVGEYLGRVLSKGLRRVGEEDLAAEVDAELRRLYKGVFVKSPASQI